MAKRLKDFLQRLEKKKESYFTPAIQNYTRSSKLLRENIGVNLRDLAFGNAIFTCDIQNTGNKRKTEKVGLIKMKELCIKDIS